MNKVIALFDFDGTLIKYNSLPFFLLFSVPLLKFMQKTVCSVPILLKYIFRLIDADDAKEKLFAVFFSGMKIEGFIEKARSFSYSVIPSLVRKKAMQRLKWHQGKKHDCILISASIQEYLSPWANSVGFSRILATSLEIDDNGNLTGRFSRKNCKGYRKVKRIEEHLGDLGQYGIYAYCDSRGDKELLEIADHPFYRSFVQEKAYPTG